jgi:hypothetical protein
MTVDWSFFLPGLIALLFPADWLLSSKVTLRGMESFRTLENSPRRRPWGWVPALWLDPVRSWFGVTLLLQSIDFGPGAWSQVPVAAYVVVLVVLAVALAIQTYTKRDPEKLLAPVGYAAGMLVALLPWEVSLLGIVTGVVALIAFRAFHAFFTVALLAIGLLGLILESRVHWLLPAMGAMVVPALVTFFTARTLELPTRADS